MAKFRGRLSCGLGSSWRFLLWVISLMCLTWSSFFSFNFHFLLFPFFLCSKCLSHVWLWDKMYHISSSFPCPDLLLTGVKGVYFSVHSLLNYSRPCLFHDLIFSRGLSWMVDKNTTCLPTVKQGCSFWSTAHFCVESRAIHSECCLRFSTVLKNKLPVLFCLTSNGSNFCFSCNASNPRSP